MIVAVIPLRLDVIEIPKNIVVFRSNIACYNVVMNETLQNSIRQLPPAEQLEIAEFIYSSLAASKQLLTEAQLDETRRRAGQVEVEPNSVLSSDEMWREVENLRNARRD